MKGFCFAVLLGLAGLLTLRAGAQPVAIPDAYATPTDSTLRVEKAGVLANDAAPPGAALRADVAAAPAHGTLALQPNGSFVYLPDLGFRGVDRFSYRAATAARFTVVPNALESFIRITVRVKARTPTGGTITGEDTQQSPVTGTVVASVTPAAAPFTEAHVTDLDLRLASALTLRVRFTLPFIGELGRITVETLADSIRVGLLEAGAPAAVAGGSFSQKGNVLGLRGVGHVTGSGLASSLPSGPQRFDTDAFVDLDDAALVPLGDGYRLELPIRFEGTFDIQGNEVTVLLDGRVAATAPRYDRLATAPTEVRLTIGPTGTAVHEVLPAAFALGASYPNPFNPTTEIPFELHTAQPARLAVFDALGREVAVLREGVLEAGSHRARFDAAGLPSGVYFYRLDVAGRTATRAMLLLK